jgi:hypothetical protein
VGEDLGNEQAKSSETFALWSDDPASIDLLSFAAIAETLTDAVLDDDLDPIALGLSGSWGSGKTTVLRLVEEELTAASADGSKVLLVSTDPWRYDPAVGVKETLIAEVLERLRGELADSEADQSVKDRAIELLGKLVKRVDWARAVRLAAQTSITLQVPKFDDLLQLVRPAPDTDTDDPVTGLQEFREEFSELMSSDALAHVHRVVVLVDDLDRCLPPTVIETLEAMRLFLAVPKMSFIIAADELRVADAIRTRFAQTDQPPEAARAGEWSEEPAQLYLHKIVQTTVPIPSLSRFDTEAFLVLLLLSTRLSAAELAPYVERSDGLRRASGSVDGLADDAKHDIAKELLLAARLTPILYEKLRGNPRRIKRFLNDLHVRQTIADRRGIALTAEVVAKLMILEVLLPEGFKKVLEWLARAELREQVAALEAAAGRGGVDQADSAADATAVAKTKAKNTTSAEELADGESEFADDLIRWAKLPPSLADVDLTPYLHLAAAFAGTPLLDTGLPERLRDLAANLLSSVRAEQKSVTDADLQALDASDAAALVRHLGRAARDRPAEQRAAVLGLLRITRLHPSALSEARTVLGAIPADDVQPAVVLGFNSQDVKAHNEVLRQWLAAAADGPTKTALTKALSEGAG